MKKQRIKYLLGLMIVLSVGSLISIHQFSTNLMGGDAAVFADSDVTSEAVTVQVKIIHFVIENFVRLIEVSF